MEKKLSYDCFVVSSLIMTLLSETQIYLQFLQTAFFLLIFRMYLKQCVHLSPLNDRAHPATSLTSWKPIIVMAHNTNNIDNNTYVLTNTNSYYLL